MEQKNKIWKFIAFGDAHGLEPVIKNKLLKDISFILSTGDYWCVNEESRDFQLKNNDKIKELLKKGMSWQEAMKALRGKEFHSLQKKEGVRWKASIRGMTFLGKPVFFVFGNTDNPVLLKKLSKNINNFISVHGRMLRYDRMVIIGIGDYIRPLRNNTERKIKKFEKKIEGLLKTVNRKRVIILSHYPPYGILDEVKGRHCGLVFLEYIVRKYKPLLFICGHIHEKQGMIKKGDTYIINAGTVENGGLLVKIRGNSVSVDCLK